LLHLVDSSVLLYLIDDARSNKNQGLPSSCQRRGTRLELFVFGFNNDDPNSRAGSGCHWYNSVEVN